MALLGAIRKLVILDVNALDAGAESEDPVLRIAVLHDVADIEMGLQPGTVKLVDEGAHFKRAKQEFVPDIFGCEDNLGALGGGDRFAKGLRDTVPGVLRAHLELRAIAQAGGVDEQRAT